jgi:hypothetical protein
MSVDSFEDGAAAHRSLDDQAPSGVPFKFANYLAQQQCSCNRRPGGPLGNATTSSLRDAVYRSEAIVVDPTDRIRRDLNHPVVT